MIAHPQDSNMADVTILIDRMKANIENSDITQEDIQDVYQSKNCISSFFYYGYECEDRSILFIKIVFSNDCDHVYFLRRQI